MYKICITLLFSTHENGFLVMFSIGNLTAKFQVFLDDFENYLV